MRTKLTWSIEGKEKHITTHAVSQCLQQVCLSVSLSAPLDHQPTPEGRQFMKDAKKSQDTPYLLYPPPLVVRL